MLRVTLFVCASALALFTDCDPWRSKFRPRETEPSSIHQASKQAPFIFVESIPLPSNHGILFDLTFDSKGRLWNLAGANGEEGEFSFSRDLGKTWASVPSGQPFGTDGVLAFFGDSQGIAGYANKVAVTEDNGASWRKQELPPDSKINEITGISFDDAEHGFLVGSASLRDRGSGETFSSMEVLCTQNGGKKWTVCFRTKAFDMAGKIVSKKEAAAALLWQTGFLRKSDAKRNWERKDVSWKPTDLCFDSVGVLWAVGLNSVMYSIDLGDSWQQGQGFDGNRELNSIAWSDDRSLAVVVGNGGSLGFSVDGGRNWEFIPVLDEDLATVRINGSDIVVLGESHIFRFQVGTGGG